MLHFSTWVRAGQPFEVAQPDKSHENRTVLCWSGKTDTEHYGSYWVYSVLSLFVVVPRSGDTQGTFSVFELSCHLLLLV